MQFRIAIGLKRKILMIKRNQNREQIFYNMVPALTGSLVENHLKDEITVCCIPLKVLEPVFANQQNLKAVATYLLRLYL